MDLVPQAPELPAKEKEVEEDMCPSSSYSYLEEEGDCASEKEKK